MSSEKLWGHGGVGRPRRRVAGGHCILHQGLLDLLGTHEPAEFAASSAQRASRGRT
jgi:hypothetical protein